jgi:hypothetical protein
MSAESWVVDPVNQIEYPVPPFASAESTLEHHARAREGLLRRIRVFPDAGEGDPLWGNDAAEYRLSVEDLGLSDTLRKELRAWQSRWQRAVSGPSKARRSEFWLTWESDGTALVEQVQAALWLVATVEPAFRRIDRQSSESSSAR